MVQDIIKNISPNLISDVIKSFGLNSEQAAETISTTKDSLVGSLGKELSLGNVEGVLGMVNQSTNVNSNPIFNRIVGKLAEDYGSKLGLSSEKAQMIASFLLPKVISAISGSKSGNINSTDLMEMVGSSAGNAIKDKASDVLKKGLGNFFK